MFLLRRTAARALSSTPCKPFFTRPRSITTVTPVAWGSRQQRWIAPAFQRRFASDDAVKPEDRKSTEPVAEEASESFAQTAAEAPVEENLTPAQESVQAEPTNASETVIPDALEEAVAETRPTKPWNQHRSPHAPEPNNIVYLGNLYYEVTADQLKRVCSRFGEVGSASIIYDNRGLSRGFGYVEFKNVNDAQAAVDNLDMQVFEGRNLIAQFHRAKPNSRTRAPDGNYEANPPSRTLFIGNMSFEMSDKDLNDLFRDIRNVLDVRVAIDRRTGQPRGFAHADFIDVASATKAKESLADKVIYGRKLRVDYSKSGTKTQREKAE